MNNAMLRANKVPIRTSMSHAPQLARYHGRFRRFGSKICTYRTRIAAKTGGALYKARNAQKRPKTAKAWFSVLDWQMKM